MEGSDRPLLVFPVLDLELCFAGLTTVKRVFFPDSPSCLHHRFMSLVLFVVLCAVKFCGL